MLHLKIQSQMCGIFLKNNGDGAGAKGIKQNCNLNPDKCEKEKKIKRAGREHRKRRLTSTME